MQINMYLLTYVSLGDNGVHNEKKTPIITLEKQICNHSYHNKKATGYNGLAETPKTCVT